MMDWIFFGSALFGLAFFFAAVLRPLDHDRVCACRCGRSTVRRYAHFTDDDVALLESGLIRICPYCQAARPERRGSGAASGLILHPSPPEAAS